MRHSSTVFRWLLVGTVGFLTAFGCDGTDAKDAGVDVVLESTPDALGAASTSAAYLSIKSVEIVPCADAGALGYKNLFSMRTAWAHAPTTPTRLGVPAVDDLAARAKVLTLGTLTPPAGTYCSVRLSFGPADADAVGMPADRAVVGRTLWITGRSGAPMTDFKLTTSEARTVELAVSPFGPGDHARHSTLHLSRSAGDALAGVDLSPSVIDDASRVVLDRLVGAMRAEVR